VPELALPALVPLQGPGGACWEAERRTGDVRRNDAGSFKGTAVAGG